MDTNIGKKLEEYSFKNPQEILIVDIEIEGEKDQILIFKGFSSSLMKPTNFDPDLPVLSPTAKIIKIDRLKSPYNPSNPIYIQQNITSWQELLNN